MALVVKDRVRETSTTTGTGTFTLAGAVAGFQSFTAIGTGNTTYYTIVMSGDWEVGLGTWTSPNQLSRDTVLASSNAGALVPFGSGTKDVFCTFPAEGFASPPAIGGTIPNTITGTTVTANTAINLPGSIPGNYGNGILEMVDGGDGYNILNIYTDEYTPVQFPGGLGAASTIYADGLYSNGNVSGLICVARGNGTNSGSIIINEESNTNYVSLTVPTTLSTTYTLTLPSTSGSNNQVLKTDGSGNLSWLDFGSPPAIGTTVAAAGAFTTLSASSTVSGTGFSTYLASPPAIGGTAPAAGTFTTLSATSVVNTSSIARAGGKTSVTSVTNTATFTTGGTTLASQTAANNATWRIRAFGTFAAVNNATARTAQVAVFWGSTQLVAITPSILISTAQTTSWQLDFTVTGSSTTAVWTAGTLLNRVASATAFAVDNATAASTTVTSGAQTIDLRFRVSTAVASEGWNVQSVTIERLV